ncbi:Clavaminate synthase-like protein [Suillus fuscotomentosus]|uniref:Clavaminate synthase-like protein n=1 Tax=Suillus fuscotomentosus TaxID=1912939 RepID=A0AAD4E5N4_9AGAM|nr:Clavaminate synthase-like protein [Suillus fuscotomentosus]KAG1900126.1 Clavaminate synthase-like protein [Suillus fuscotomentosus]
MSSITLPYVPHHVAAPPTKENLEYADLAIIDISKASSEEGLAALAIELREALLKFGFFYVVNHGYSQTQTARMFDIADVPFSAVTDGEKQLYASTRKQNGMLQGYTLLQYADNDGQVRDQLEQYCINRDVTKRKHPEALVPLLPEIQEFSKHNYFNVLTPILRLIACSLELPEDTLLNKHVLDAVDESAVRFIKYYPRTEEEEAKTKNVWLKGHTDFGSITILWSQPVAALQIQTREGKWRWIRHMENALVVNVGDAMEFLTGGYYKGTIHRVVQPAVDQRNYTRLGVFYFAIPNDDIKLVPMVESPVLQRVGIQGRCEDSEAPTMEDWRKARTMAYGQSKLKNGKEDGIEEEVIHGVKIKHYN